MYWVNIETFLFFDHFRAWGKHFQTQMTPFSAAESIYFIWHFNTINDQKKNKTKKNSLKKKKVGQKGQKHYL